MPEPQERHYNINKLNAWFAITTILLLLSIIWMFMDDYSREWKGYQKEFRDLEIEKARVKLDTEENKLKKSDEYQALTTAIEQTKREVEEKCSQQEDVKIRLARLQAENDLLKHNLKIRSAERDAARFRYEEAIDKNHDADKAKGEFETIQQTVTTLKLQVEESDAKLNRESYSLSQCDQKLKDLKRQEIDLVRQVTVSHRKLRKIDPDQMNFPTYVANLIRDLPVIDFANPKYKIEQIVLKDITDSVNFMEVPKADRCITCHAGIANPDYKNAAQPFRTHPNLELYLGTNSPHPMEEFGCTVCHGGRGRGTDFVSAVHTPSTLEQEKEWEEKYHWHKFHHWETPMYPMTYVEAGCFKCHSGETVIKGAEKLNLGLHLVEKAGCYTCHNIEKYKDWPKPGPDLTHLASKISKDWAYRWIMAPKSFRHNTWMPSFYGQSNNDGPVFRKRSEQEIHAMVHYLFAKSQAFQMESIPQRGDTKRGEEIVHSIGCMGCHNIQHEPMASVRTRQSLRREHGPNLTGLGTKATPAWLYNWLKDPNRYHPQTRMPNLRLTDQEAADVVAFLSEDKNNEFIQEPIPAVNEEIINNIVRDFMVKANTMVQTHAQMAQMSLDDKLLYVGEKLIGHYGCFSCHNIVGFEDFKPIGTELTEEGSKAVDRLDFGFIDIPHTKEAWFKQKLKDPRIFDKDKIKAPDEKLRMPNYNFTDEEAEAITTAILGFVKERPAPSKSKPRTAENLYIEEGQKLVREFNCQACHIMEGEGGAIQPMVTQWLITFDNRDESEAQAITTGFSPPNLIGEGKKVHADWLFNFLHQPETIRPWLKVRMPTYKFNAEHLNALVKYFSALDKQEFPFTEMMDTSLTPEEYEIGKKLFSDDYFGCAKCHIVGDKMPSGSPDSWAPNFALAKKRLKPQWISGWIKDPQSLLPGTKMPNFYDPQAFDGSGPEDILNGDENKQIEVLRNFLLTLADDNSVQVNIEMKTPKTDASAKAPVAPMTTEKTSESALETTTTPATSPTPQTPTAP